MVDISDPKWSEQDPSNNGAAPDGIQGNYAPNTVAPILRGTRGATKRAWTRINAAYTTSGTATTAVLTYSQGPATYFKGERFAFWANATNTGAMTLNINALGAKSILRSNGTALTAGDITTGTFTELVYDGTAFRIINSTQANPTYTGTVTAGAIEVTGNANVGASLTAKDFATTGTITGILDHRSGYMTISPYNSAYGTDAGRLWYDANENRFNFQGPTSSFATLRADTFLGNATTATTAATANLLNGQPASYYTNLANSTGTLPNARLSGAYSGITLSSSDIEVTGSTWSSSSASTGLTVSGGAPNIWYHQTDTGPSILTGINGTAWYVMVDDDSNRSYDRSALVVSTVAGTDMMYHGSVVWTAANDGSGSGLNADMVDGYHVTDLAPATRSITSGNGLSGGGTLGADRTISLGTPSTITGATGNTTSATSHTHALSLVAADINGALGYTAANAGRVIVAGNGMSGGGSLAADRTITLGTPGTLTTSTTNAVTATSHTHAINIDPADIGAVPTGRAVAAGNGLTGGGALTAAVTLTLGTPGSITNSTTNAVTQTSHTHALGFVAAEVYTGSSAANLTFPVGHMIMVNGLNLVRNATDAVYVDGGNTSFYTFTPSGTALTGTWRARGLGSSTNTLMQRVS